MNPPINILSINDLIIPWLFVPLLLYGLALIKAKYKWDKPWDNFLIIGFLIRIVCVVLFALIYQYYYKSGDTFIYYQEAQNIRNALFNGDIDSFFELIFKQYNELSFKSLKLIDQDYLYYNKNNHLLIGIAGLINIFCFDSYIGIALFMAFYGYLGTFLLYREYCKLYPSYYIYIALILIFLPSTFFWSSGLMKEPICIGALSFIIYFIIKLRNYKKNVILFSVIIIINAFLLFTIKSYIFYSFSAALILAWFVSRFAKSKFVSSNPKVWFIIPFTLIASIILASYFIELSISSKWAQFFISQISNTQTAQIQASVESGGSGYELGELSPTPIGIISFTGNALTTTLFRPYIWEIRKPILIANGLEALFTLIFTLVFIKASGIRNFFYSLFTDHLALTFIFYTIFMGIVIGIISFNFGTLVRYKAPLIGFYFLAIFITYAKCKTDKTSNRNCELKNNEKSL
jgi:hypothetical protein